MSCPICDHTMQNVGNHFWCPRCGTLRQIGNFEEVNPPLHVKQMLQATAFKTLVDIDAKFNVFVTYNIDVKKSEPSHLHLEQTHIEITRKQ